jgi:hypothetical protein
MNNQESFIVRWSRRKQAAGTAPENSDVPVALSPADLKDPVESENTVGAEHSAEDRRALPTAAPTPVEPVFDPLSVPPVESIVANTDIRGFLAPGVPPELTREALRRAWVADPTIRDFVGLADYDWDFNAPNSIAGFGPLEMTDDLRRVVAQILGPSLAPDQTAAQNPSSAHVISDQGAGEPDVTASARTAGPAHVVGVQTAALKQHEDPE